MFFLILNVFFLDALNPFFVLFVQTRNIKKSARISSSRSYILRGRGKERGMIET